MINQMVTSVNKNVFAPLQTNGTSYAIAKPFTDTQKTEHEKAKENKRHKFGLAIAGAGLVVGFSVLFAFKMLSKKSSLNITKIGKKIEEQTVKLKENKGRDFIQNAFLQGLKFAKSVITHSKATFTFATLKDMLVRKTLTQVPVLKKFSDSVTNLFEKISVKTSTGAYSITEKRFEKMYANFAEINNKLPQNQADKIAAKVKHIRENYYEAFSEEARVKRFAQAKDDMGDILGRTWGASYGNILAFVKNPETYSKFLAEEQAAPAKIKLNNVINSLKDQISISTHNKYKATKDLLNNIDLFIDPTDKESRALMKNLKAHLTEYNKALLEGKNNNNFPNSELAKDLETLNSYISKSKVYDEKTVPQISEAIKNLTRILSENKTGEIQEVMGIYKQCLSAEDYAKLEKTVNKALKSLDHSVDLEGDKLFDKVRDLKLGSAIHDTLAFFGSIIGVSWYLGKADDKDERISAALKYGIPAIVGVLTAILCTVGLIASGPSFIIGGISGLAINKIGETIDNARKK